LLRAIVAARDAAKLMCAALAKLMCVALAKLMCVALAKLMCVALRDVGEDILS
jgi:hypothetical protein